MKITEEILKDVRKWLGKDGKEFFEWCLSEHGGITPVYIEDGIPHLVHFREGMVVRNHMRQSGLCNDWTAHDFDNNWARVVKKSLFPEIF